MEKEHVKALGEKGIVTVHVANPHDLVQKVEQISPAHIVTVTLAIPVLSINGAKVLELDESREEAFLNFVGTGTAYFCHSLTQASRAAAGSTSDGAIISAGNNFTVKGTGQAWCVGAAGSSLSVGIVQSKRSA